MAEPTSSSAGSTAGRWSAGSVLVVVLICVGVVSTAGIVIGAILADADREFWLEVAKAGVQVLAVGLVGGAVAAAWRFYESARSEDRQKRAESERQVLDERENDLVRRRQARDEQLEVFRRAVRSYNDVKAIRRILRSVGFRNATGELSPEQVAEFRRQMRRLNTRQLEFEVLKRDVVETNVFDLDTDHIYKQFRLIEKHLNGVLRIWEHHGVEIYPGSDAQRVAQGLDGLIGKYEGFRDGVVAPFRNAAQIMHRCMFDGAPALTMSALKERDEEDDDAELSGRPITTPGNSGPDRG